ncbi:MAG: MarR family winged helix-turn-helix transcriptional regulator [Ktedonobacterales bacterium]
MKTPVITRSEWLRKPSVISWLRLARVHQKVNRATTEFMREYGLSTAQFDVLAQISATEGCTQQELADRLFVTKGNISQLLERLEQRGLIRRKPQGRAYQLYLTNEGQSLTAKAVPAQEEFIARLFGGLTYEEQSQLRHLLDRLDHELAHELERDIDG